MKREGSKIQPFLYQMIPEVNNEREDSEGSKREKDKHKFVKIKCDLIVGNCNQR